MQALTSLAPVTFVQGDPLRSHASNLHDAEHVRSRLPVRATVVRHLDPSRPLKRRTLCRAEQRSNAGGNILSAALPLADVQQSLQLELEDGEQGKTVTVKSVAAGSRAQQNGIVAGQQLLALSQTRGQKFWTLDPDGIEEQDWISAGRFAWENLGISSNENVELVFSQPANATSLLDEVENSQKASQPQPQQRQSTIGANLSSKYDEQYPDNPMVSALERRIKRRKERQEAEQNRNDVPFFLFVLGVFVVPPLVIILIAYSTGYLDSLSGHYTSTH